MEFNPGAASDLDEAVLLRLLANADTNILTDAQVAKLDAINTALYALLGAAQNFTAAQGVTPVALTDAANIATDASLSNNFTVTLAGNRTLDNPTNVVAGRVYVWTITQDGTGGRTLAFGSNFDFPGGTAPTLSTAAGAVDLLTGYALSDSRILCTSNLGFA